MSERLSRFNNYEIHDWNMNGDTIRRKLYKEIINPTRQAAFIREVQIREDIKYTSEDEQIWWEKKWNTYPMEMGHVMTDENMILKSIMLMRNDIDRKERWKHQPQWYEVKKLILHNMEIIEEFCETNLKDSNIKWKSAPWWYMAKYVKIVNLNRATNNELGEIEENQGDYDRSEGHFKPTKLISEDLESLEELNYLDDNEENMYESNEYVQQLLTDENGKIDEEIMEEWLGKNDNIDEYNFVENGILTQEQINEYKSKTENVNM